MGANASLYSSTFSSLNSINSSINQAKAAEDQAEFQASQGAFNARLADYQAESAVRMGDRAALEVARKAGQFKGKQKASLAAQGIVTTSGSAAKVLEETDEMAYEDQQTAHLNAAMAAFGYKTQAATYEASGKFAKAAARNVATNTLVTGGMAALGTTAGGYSDWWKVNHDGVVETSKIYYTKAAKIKGSA